jgi:DNA-binding HxlR family transcriptional regulator
MNSQLSLSNELRKLIESKLEQTLIGIENTFSQILKKQDITPIELKENIKNLEENFGIISKKWSLEILYTLLLKEYSGFGEIKKILGVNSRTLSDKLKTLNHYKYIDRKVENGPPLRVQYSLTDKGKNTVLLALPLLYYSSK